MISGEAIGYMDPDERRRQALEDAAGFPAHLADVVITGFDSDRAAPPQRSNNRQDGATRNPHVSHRGGRSFPEPGDSELDPEMHWPVQELSDTQRAINADGIRLARAALDAAAGAHLDQGPDTLLAAARQRARLERVSRQP